MESKKVIEFFIEISKIPRPSYHCTKIADYLCNFARLRKFEYHRDNFDNVIIIKPAAHGKENNPAVMLQGHTDIVAEKTPQSNHNFQCDPIQLVIDDDIIKTKGTTLGADNGFALSLMLALLDSETNTPRLECVFTSDEEVGMLGAEKIDLSSCRAEYLINLDSDEEGVFTCGCAGGARLDFSLPVEREKEEISPIKITISGLSGGHSGTEIGKGNLNAVKLMAELLSDCKSLVAIDRIGPDNAIAESCTSIAGLSKEEIESKFKILYQKYSHIEKDLKIDISEADRSLPMSKECSRKVIDFINALPYGVAKKFKDRDLVHTSNNIGSIETEHDSIHGVISLRSVNEKDLLTLGDEISTLCKNSGGKTLLRDKYPGWDYNENSALRELMIKNFKEMFNTAPKVDVIHAGLECGVILSKMPNLDIVSIGADIKDIHTPAERLSISSAVRTTEFVLKVLENIK